MPLMGAIIDGEPVPWDSIPYAVLQPEIVKAMRHHDRGGVHLSDLIGCPFDTVRKRRYKYYLPVNNIYFMARGKAWDALIEKNTVPNRYPQMVLSRQLDGVTIWGTPDIVDFEIKRIEDNKAPVRLKGYQEIPLSYALQVNGYRWLIERNLTIGDLRLNACAHFGFEQIEVPIFPLEEVEEELSMRLHVLMDVAVMDDVVPRCERDSCYCYSDGYVDVSQPLPWGLKELHSGTVEEVS